jgi:O-antigen/teichoic acid export membrane protein
VNVVLNLALIPQYGATAAAWIAMSSELVILAGVLALVRRFTGFTPSTRVALRALLAGAVMIPAMLTTQSLPAVSLAVGAGAYALTLYVLRVHRVVRRTAA